MQLAAMNVLSVSLSLERDMPKSSHEGNEGLLEGLLGGLLGGRIWTNETVNEP